MLHLIWIALVGLIVGALAKLIVPGKDPGGIIVTMVLGVVGSLVATWLGQLVGLYHEGDSAGFIMSILGAALLLVVYHFFRKKVA